MAGASDYSELVACKADGTIVPKVLTQIRSALGIGVETYSTTFTSWRTGWSTEDQGGIGWRVLTVALREGKYLYLGGLLRNNNGWGDGDPVCQIPASFNPNRNIKSSTIEITPDGLVKIVGSRPAGGLVGVHATGWKHTNF